MKTTRLDQLFDAYFDEALSPTDRAELEYLLLSSPQARQHFWKRARFQALLRRFGAENWGKWLAEKPGFAAAETPDKRPDTMASGPSRGVAWGWREWLQPGLRWAPAALAAVLVCLLVFWRPLVTSRRNNEQASSSPATLRGVAELVHAVNVEWSEPANRLGAGTVLEPGWLKFKRGLIELQFYRGASVVLEGPAEFQLISDMEGFCKIGKLRVDVPPSAHGFKLRAPHAQVVDLGTAFGIDVHRDGQAEVHVLEGKVEMANAPGQPGPRELTQGQSVHIDGTGQMIDIQSKGAAFLSSAEVKRRLNAQSQRQYQAWREFSRQLAQDSSLLLYYDFEGSSGTARTLSNRAQAATPESTGTIIGCQWTEGRWPHKSALDFKQFGDRVRFSLAASPTSLTCMAWVRVDGLSHAYNALLMAGDGCVGETQWQLKAPGVIIFGKRIVPGWGLGHVDASPTQIVIGPEQMGLWVHLAFVYDTPSQTVTHYVNGRAVCTKSNASILPVRLGSMEIGNWTPREGDPLEPVRNFNGRLDEFAVFGRALAAQEIAHAFEIGRPE